MNILVATSSRHGSTREIGSAIADTLREAGHTVDELKMEEARGVEQYNSIIVGCAVYMGGWLPEVRAFVERNRRPLDSMPVWLFSSGPIGPSTPALDARRLEESAGLSVRDHRVFPGKLDRRQLGFGERLAVRLVKAPEGDFRDWEDIRQWARKIGAHIGSVSVRPG
ncbi:MAG TPA: flavodoxin domain-containing protein [Chloroflexota bacterium]|nr:flavodoxin domain-containing protein [Chloroflexota bacterium]